MTLLSKQRGITIPSLTSITNKHRKQCIVMTALMILPALSLVSMWGSGMLSVTGSVSIEWKNSTENKAQHGDTNANAITTTLHTQQTEAGSRGAQTRQPLDASIITFINNTIVTKSIDSPGIYDKETGILLMKGVGVYARMYAEMFAAVRLLHDRAATTNAPLHDTMLEAQTNGEIPAGTHEMMQALEHALFPWFDTNAKGSPKHPMFASAWDAYAQSSRNCSAVRVDASADTTTCDSNRGIVMTTGSGSVLVAKHTLTMLRRIESTLPIEIMYCGNADLAETDRNTLADVVHSTAHVPFSDGTDITGNKTQKTIPAGRVRFVDMSNLLGDACQGSWAIKPFAVLASSFRHAILIDEDAMFFQKPESMFDMAGYVSTGAFLFRDRTASWGSWGRGPGLLQMMSEIAEPYYDNLLMKPPRVRIEVSSEEIDSGVVAWDKYRTFVVLLLTCALNYGALKDHTHRVTHGDKETFWLAHEALHVPFGIGAGNGGAIGIIKDSPKRVCGPMIHPDDTGNPLWCNGGMGRPKHHTTSPWYTINPTHWAYESDAHATWTFDKEPFCLVVENNVDFKALGRRDLVIGQAAHQLWVDIFYST